MIKDQQSRLNNTIILIMLLTAIVDVILALMESILGNINVALILFVCREFIKYCNSNIKVGFTA